MKARRIIDVPFYDAIVTISEKVGRYITLSSRHGNINIITPQGLLHTKQGDKLRIVKLLRIKSLERAKGNPFALKPNEYSLCEWRQNGNYNFYKEKLLRSEYITFEKAYNKWIQQKS